MAQENILDEGKFIANLASVTEEPSQHLLQRTIRVSKKPTTETQLTDFYVGWVSA
jgi:hypothetical protein